MAFLPQAINGRSIHRSQLHRDCAGIDQLQDIELYLPYLAARDLCEVIKSPLPLKKPKR